MLGHSPTMRPVAPPGNGIRISVGIPFPNPQQQPPPNNTPGDAFGELSLLYNAPRAANVIAKEDCVLWKLDRSSFNAIVKDAAQKKRDRYEGFLAKVPLLKDMDSYMRSQVSDGLKAEKVAGGDNIITQGEDGDKFYILEEGKAAAYKDGGKVLDYNSGDFFGELALLKNAPRAATVKAETDCTVLSLDRGAFKRLFGGAAELQALSKVEYS